jgi:hypothetical protein
MNEGQVKVDIIRFAKCEVLNSQGISIPVHLLWKNHTVVFIFLRHFACLICKAHATQIWEKRNEIQKNGAKIVFIGNGAPQFIEGFKEELTLDGSEIYTDPTLNIFKAAGFKRGFVSAIGPRALMNGIKLKSKGFKQGEMKEGIGDLWQLGGVVTIKPGGHVAYHYISEVAGDFPPEKDFDKS